MRKEKNYVIKNTIYCIKYIWKIDRKYILLMVVISILTSLFNIINLSILRYITETIAMQEMRYFLMIIGVMLLLSVVIAIINGSASYLYEPLLQNRIIEKIQGDIYAKAKTFNLEEYDNEEFYDLYYFVAENGKTGIFVYDLLNCLILDYTNCPKTAQFCVHNSPLVSPECSLRRYYFIQPIR